MARPEEVDHGRFHGKIVRVYPERINCEFFREEYEHWTKRPCTMSDDEIRSATVENAKKFGYASGDTAKVVMVSRLGDCGITKNLEAEYGYDFRIAPECLMIKTDKKFKRPTAEEAAEGHGYTPEEYAEIKRALAALQVAEWDMREARDAWKNIVWGKTRVEGNMLHSARAVSLARFRLRTQRKIVRDAHHAYWAACVPQRLRLHRAAKMMGSYIKERLGQESFAEKILPPVVLPAGNRHERRAAEAKARKKT